MPISGETEAVVNELRGIKRELQIMNYMKWAEGQMQYQMNYRSYLKWLDDNIPNDSPA